MKRVMPDGWDFGRTAAWTVVVTTVFSLTAWLYGAVGPAVGGAILKGVSGAFAASAAPTPPAPPS